MIIRFAYSRSRSVGIVRLVAIIPNKIEQLGRREIRRVARTHDQRLNRQLSVRFAVWHHPSLKAVQLRFSDAERDSKPR
jgi:hypothetical protein